jgi:hypothetical protein
VCSAFSIRPPPFQAWLNHSIWVEPLEAWEPSLGPVLRRIIPEASIPPLMPSRLIRSAAIAAILIVSAPGPARAQSPGRAVLEKMNAAYAGRWYKTLTFIQKTTIYRPDASSFEQTWWESVRYTPERGVQLRIDRVDLALGNGSLQTADSSWIVRGGALAQTRPTGNEFLPLIEGVYVQPLDLTERQVRAIGVDLSRSTTRQWRGRPTTVVGTGSPADTTTTQMWIDDERQVLVRMILKGTAPQPSLDILIDGYQRAGGGWLGTKVDILIDGVLRQREEYTEWKTDIPLPDALFNPATWSTAPHWGRKP